MAGRRESVSQVQVEVLAERVANLEKALPELRTDVKMVLALVTDLKVAMASRPSEKDFRDLTKSVEELHQNRAYVLGGWKVVVILSGVVGFLASFLQTWLRGKL